ncbi:MAG: hypothetical protein U9R15_08660 [Chloroflexota bacterium]|nr:hypothetical protein [Chloroflexota bacterium]
MSATEAYVDALEKRIADLEVDNTKLQKTITGMSQTIKHLTEAAK